jgi:tetratricopeptide (TPR) repeat protein
MNGFSAIPGPIKVVMAVLAALIAIIGPLLVTIASYNILMAQATIANARFAASMRAMMAAMGWVGLIGLAIGLIASFAVSTDDATKSFDDFKKSLEGLKVPGENIAPLTDEINNLTTQISESDRKIQNLKSQLSVMGQGNGPIGSKVSVAREIQDLEKERQLLLQQRSELAEMLRLDKERKAEYDKRVEAIKAHDAELALARQVGSRSFNEILAKYRQVEKSIKDIQDAARSGGDAIKAVQDIGVLNEELTELRSILQALGYSFDKTKTDVSGTVKELTDWEKAIAAAKEAMAQAKAEFEVTGDNISKLEAYAAAQQQLAVAAALFGKTETQEGIDALAKFIEYTSQSNAAKEARDFADAMDAANSAFNETMSGLDFEKGLGGITDAEYTQQRADAFRTLADAMLDLGQIDVAEAYYNQALALDALIKKQEESKQLQVTQNQEFLSFVQNIGNAFGNIFRDLTSGSKTFAEVLKTNMIDALTAILAKLVAIAIMWGIIAILSGGTSVLSGAAQGIKAAGFGSFAMGQFGLGSFANKSAPVTVDGSISGHTIYLSNKRALNSYDRTYGG